MNAGTVGSGWWVGAVGVIAATLLIRRASRFVAHIQGVLLALVLCHSTTWKNRNHHAWSRNISVGMGVMRAEPGPYDLVTDVFKTHPRFG